jgi:acetyl/propionyl-CoA carboxylase alpha subunit
MDFEYFFEGGLRKVRLEKKEGGYAVRAGDEAFEAGILEISEHELLLFDGRRAVPAYLAREGERLHVSLGGRTFVLSPPAPAVTSRQGDDGSHEDARLIKSPMPGKVIKILVAEGEAVRRNQTLAIVEAMKMENEIKSACEGVVRTIHARVGELVGARMILIEIEPKT